MVSWPSQDAWICSLAAIPDMALGMVHGVVLPRHVPAARVFEIRDEDREMARRILGRGEKEEFLMQRFGFVVARILLAAIFLLSGAGKLVDVEDTSLDIAEIGLPFPALAAVAAGVLELACGLLLILGRKTGWAAAGLLLFMVPVTALFEHPFRGGMGALIDFLKNCAIMGGLLMVVLRETDAMLKK